MELFYKRLLMCFAISASCHHLFSAAQVQDTSTASRLYRSFGPGSHSWLGLITSSAGVIIGVIGTSIGITQAIKSYRKMQSIKSDPTLAANEADVAYNQAKTNLILSIAASSFLALLGAGSSILFARKIAEGQRDFKLSARLPTVMENATDPIQTWVAAPPSTSVSSLEEVDEATDHRQDSPASEPADASAIQAELFAASLYRTLFIPHRPTILMSATLLRALSVKNRQQ